MDGYTLRYLPSAQKDIRSAAQLMRLKGKNSAETFVTDFVRAAEQIAEDPQKGIVPRDDLLEALGYRMKLVGNYYLFYRMKDEAVEIYRLIRGFRTYEFLI